MDSAIPTPHDPRHGIQKECKRQVDMGPDGSVELYDALACITHARNFIGNKPGLLLMAMFPNYGVTFRDCVRVSIRGRAIQ